jgi:hypothetical protein
MIVSFPLFLLSQLLATGHRTGGSVDCSIGKRDDWRNALLISLLVGEIAGDGGAAVQLAIASPSIKPGERYSLESERLHFPAGADALALSNAA